jgi:hypothetical protein
MEARELRIGNLCKEITPIKNGIMIVSKRHFENIENNEIDLFPIPLTEEWLLKFGFKKNESKWFQINYFTDCSESAEEMGIVFNIVSNRCGFYDVENEDGYAMTAKRIYYVHQLQNLYFALTNTELTTQELNQ